MTNSFEIFYNNLNKNLDNEYYSYIVISGDSKKIMDILIDKKFPIIFSESIYNDDVIMYKTIVFKKQQTSIILYFNSEDLTNYKLTVVYKQLDFLETTMFIKQLMKL